MSKLWFKRKTYGWGWVPVSIEGWLVVFVYAIFIWWLFKDADTHLDFSIGTLIWFALPLVFSTAVLIGVCYWKGEKPRWSWGEKKDEESK
jgi:hypothetical protein